MDKLLPMDGIVLSIDGWPIVAVTVLVVLDVLTGYIKAAIAGEVSSSTMREGLIHKGTYFVFIALFVLIEVMQSRLHIADGVPTAMAVCVYVCATEIVSVLENLAEINPDIAAWPLLKQLIAALKSTTEEE